jgi:raffinose/stachyose/melibiose transport system substrate-binding protein
MALDSKMTRRTVLAGAAAAAGLASIEAKAAPKQVVWWYEGATAAQQAALDQHLVKPFNASQSEYELVIEYRGAALPDQLLVALSAGSGPDIVLTNGPSWTQRLVISKRLLPLNDLAHKFQWDTRIVPFMLGMGTYDGTLFAIPKTSETQVLYYNSTLFNKNGWVAPTTLAEFEAVADKMLKAGIMPLAAGNAGTRFVNRHYAGASFSCCAGPENVYKALSGKLPWNDPSFVESIQLLKNWWDKGYFGGKKYFALSMQQAFALMAAGKSGMALQGSWAFQWVDETFKKTRQDLDWVPIPRLSPTAPYPVFPLGIGADLAINAATRVPEGAAMVLNALLDHKFIIAMSEAWGGEWDSPLVSPPEPGSNLDRVTALAVKLNYETTKALQSKAYGYAPWTFWPARTDDYMKGGMEEVWLGQITAKQFCDKVNDVFQEDLKDGLVKTLPARA